jgi:hypothetical protein
MDNDFKGKTIVRSNFVYYDFHFTQWVEGKFLIPRPFTYSHETIIIIQVVWCCIPNKT